MVNRTTRQGHRTNGDADCQTSNTPDGAGQGDFPFGANAEDAAPPKSPEGSARPVAASDPYDPASLRITGDFNASVNLKKAILSIPVRKPDKSWWIRAHPDAAYHLQTAVIELKGEKGPGESYLVAPHLRGDLATEPTFRPKLIVAAVTSTKDPFLWELALPNGQRDSDWTETGLEALQLAMKGWTRVAANMGAGRYDAWTAVGAKLPEPEWPALSMRDWLQFGFKGRVIDALDHPVLLRLRGEVL